MGREGGFSLLQLGNACQLWSFGGLKVVFCLCSADLSISNVYNIVSIIKLSVRIADLYSL